MGYHVVPPPPTGVFSPPKPDLSYTGLKEFQIPEFQGYGPKTNESENISAEIKIGSSQAEKLVTHEKIEKQTVNPSIPKV